MTKLKRYGETDSDAGIIHCSDGKYYLVEEVDPVIQELETQLKEKDCRIQELKLTISNANDRIKELEELIDFEMLGDILYVNNTRELRFAKLEELKRKAGAFDRIEERWLTVYPSIDYENKKICHWVAVDEKLQHRKGIIGKSPLEAIENLRAEEK